MTDPSPSKPSVESLKTVRRKVVQMSTEALVETSDLQPGQNLPLVVRPVVNGLKLASWAASNRDFMAAHLLKHGALLFRGFDVNSVDEFEQFIKNVSGELLEYRDRSTPRHLVSGNVYTSTDHPADQSIFLHNENSYAQTWPLKIFFFCMTPAEQGGETPLADTRKVFQRISKEIREKLIDKGIKYVRNFGHGLGLSWQTVFQTEEKAVVDAYCGNTGYDVEWKGSDRLRISRTGQAVARHPQSGEIVWFNHAAFFQVSTLQPEVREAFLAAFDEEDLPNHAYYGDGSPIESSVLDHLRDVYRQETVLVPLQRGEVLMLDNMLTAHGRMPFAGARRVLAGMAEPYSCAKSA